MRVGRQVKRFDEGDVFRIIVPLDEEYSFDFNIGKNETKSAEKVPISADKVPISADKMPINADGILEENLSKQQRQVLQYVKENGKITSHQAELLLQVKQRRARAILGEMAAAGLLEKQGAYKTTAYVIKEGRYCNSDDQEIIDEGRFYYK